MPFPQDGQMPQPYFGGQQGGEDGNASGVLQGNSMQMGGAPNSDPGRIDFVLDAVYSSL
ncbi:hypothetical protein EG327_007713 [Venturia inaequalis]|uniref:Uncharacterized protein n=1 Tax=Venturia inaequalis TaxID=5025 RepID=A0A8H3VP46_VENIN|nr:hypothetical protein EG327_007713 [Venturia inaequalis]